MSKVINPLVDSAVNYTGAGRTIETNRANYRNRLQFFIFTAPFYGSILMGAIASILTWFIIRRRA
jgi:hypothetical protein